jgi:hypothetical protein
MSGKRLSEKERNDIARRIAAGESYPTIAERSGCSIQNVKYYAAKIRPKVEAIIVAEREARTVDAIGAGLREKDGRVDELIWMYGEVKADLSDGLYGTDTKISATGKTVQVPVFKAPQITQARGLLDDIAKEEGGRKNVTTLQGDKDSPLEVHYDISDADLDRELLRIAERTGRRALADREVSLGAAGPPEPAPPTG